jgi:RimJ/RimL family protein N-acetyltransferase
MGVERPASATALSADGRVTLRPFREADALALHPIFADPHAMRFWSTPPHTRFEQTQAYVRATMAATAAGEGDDQIVLHEGRVIGKAGLWDNEEIGFVLAPNVWGKGLGREAVALVIERARSRGLPRILADVDPRNEASLRLLRRLGFLETGRAGATLQVGDEWVDSVYLELVLA